ncbi:MAG: hypothetical protein P8L36_18215 [SAR324 cluster bacterium]|nr:hypothetical protein [SAR324 cluster bacterium]
MSKWLNWKPRDKETVKHKAIFLTPIPQNNKKQRDKPSWSTSSGAFATLRKVYTIGIAPQDFLSAIKAKENTYFGLHPDEATHTTKERLAMLEETLAEALDTELSFEFLCVHKKERKELLLTVATMLPNEWTIRVKGMYLKGVPPKGESDEDY